MMLTFNLDLDVEQGDFYYKVKVNGQDLGHYQAKLFKRFRFSQNVLTLLAVIS